MDKPEAHRAAKSDPLRKGSPELGHAVHHGTGYPRFHFLRRERASAERGTDQGLVAKHRGFDQRTSAVAHRLCQPRRPLSWIM
jgi:hypothetical protein